MADRQPLSDVINLKTPLRDVASKNKIDAMVPETCRNLFEEEFNVERNAVNNEYHDQLDLRCSIFSLALLLVSTLRYFEKKMIRVNTEASIIHNANDSDGDSDDSNCECLTLSIIYFHELTVLLMLVM